MTHNWYDNLSEAIKHNFKEIPVTEDWFKVYEIMAGLFVFYEPRHYEQTLANLIVGKHKAVLIDTGCGIGDLRRAVEEVTDKPVMVVNTHTHSDHLGSNHQFNEIAMFEHPLSHEAAKNGVSHQVMQREILADNLIIKPWPRNFDPNGFCLPPFKVSHWLKDGDLINAGDRDLLVIHTPGEAMDHICLLDKTNRILFCGDILVPGSVWTHLKGGSLQDLIKSYHRLMDFFNDFDYLMSGHNEPWIEKSLLPETLKGAEKVASGRHTGYRDIIDPWNRKLRLYPFGRFNILTQPKI